MPNTPAINPDLILQYADQYKSGDPAGLTNLVSIFDFLKRSTDRAEGLSRAYLAQMDKLLRNQTTQQPLTHLTDSGFTQQKPTKPEKPAKPSTSKDLVGPLRIEI